MAHLWTAILLAVISSATFGEVLKRSPKESRRNEEKVGHEESGKTGRAVSSVSDLTVEQILPLVTFKCKSRPSGYYADSQFDCEVFHYCREDGTRITIACPSHEPLQQKHQICLFQEAAVKTCGQSQIFLALPEHLFQNASSTTASAVNGATDFQLPFFIPQPTEETDVATLATNENSDGEGAKKGARKLLPSSATRKAAVPFALFPGSDNISKKKQSERSSLKKSDSTTFHFSPSALESEKDRQEFEVFASSLKGRSAKQKADRQPFFIPFQRSSFPFTPFNFRDALDSQNVRIDEETEKDRFESDSSESQFIFKPKEIEVRKTVFTLNNDNNAKNPNDTLGDQYTAYSEDSSDFRKTDDYRSFFLPNSDDEGKAEDKNVYLIEVYHKDFAKVPTRDNSFYRRKSKISFAPRAREYRDPFENEAKYSLTEGKQKRSKRKKRMVVKEVTVRRPYAVFYANVPEPMKAVGGYESRNVHHHHPTSFGAEPMISSHRVNHGGPKLSLNPAIVPLDLPTIPISFHSPAPAGSTERPPQRLNPVQKPGSGNKPKSAVIYANDNDEKHHGPQVSAQQNIYFVSPEHLGYNPASQESPRSPEISANDGRLIRNPSYRPNGDQQSDPGEITRRPQYSNDPAQGAPFGRNNFQPQQNSPRQNSRQISDNLETIQPFSGGNPNFAPQNIPYLQGQPQSPFFFSPQEVIPNGGFPTFGPFGNQEQIQGRPQPDERRPQLGVQYFVPPTPPQLAQNNENDGRQQKPGSSEEYERPTSQEQSPVSGENRQQPGLQGLVARQPNFELPPQAFQPQLFAGFHPFSPPEYGGPFLPQNNPQNQGPFGLVPPQQGRPLQQPPNIQTHYISHPQQQHRQPPYRGNQNRVPPSDSAEQSSSEEDNRERNRFNNGRQQPNNGYLPPQQGLRLPPPPPHLRERPNIGNDEVSRPNGNRFYGHPQAQHRPQHPGRPRPLDSEEVNGDENLQRPPHLRPNGPRPQEPRPQSHPRPYDSEEINGDNPNDLHRRPPPPPPRRPSGPPVQHSRPPVLTRPYDSEEVNDRIPEDIPRRPPPQVPPRPNGFPPQNSRPERRPSSHSSEEISSSSPDNRPQRPPSAPSSDEIRYGYRTPPDTRDFNFRGGLPHRPPPHESPPSNNRLPPPQNYAPPGIRDHRLGINVQPYSLPPLPTAQHLRPGVQYELRNPENTRYNGNQGQNNLINVVSNSEGFGDRPQGFPPNSEANRAQGNRNVNDRIIYTTSRPVLVGGFSPTVNFGRAPNSDHRVSPQPYRPQVTHYDDESEEERSRYQDEKATAPSTTSPPTRPPPKRKPLPPRPTFPPFPTFPPPIPRPSSTVAPFEEESLESTEPTSDVDPNAHTRNRQNSRPRPASITPSVEYNDDSESYHTESEEDSFSTDVSTSPAPRPRQRKRFKGRVRRPRPTVRQNSNEEHDFPVTMTTVEQLDSVPTDQKYGGRMEITTVRPLPLTTAASLNEVSEPASTEYGSRINLFGRQRKRKQSNYQSRVALTTTSAPEETSASDDGTSTRKTPKSTSNRRRRPYKKRMRARTTTTTTTTEETPALTEAIARSDEEGEFLEFEDRETVSTIATTEWPITAIPTTTEVVTMTEPVTATESFDTKDVESRRPVVNKFRNRPRLLNFGKPRLRSTTSLPGTDEEADSGDVMEVKGEQIRKRRNAR